VLTKIEAIDIKVGYILLYNTKLHLVNKTMHTKPGKGGAYIQVETKEVVSKLKGNFRFRSNETVQRARIDQRKYQFLYPEDNTIVLMDKEDFTQINISKDLFGSKSELLDEEIEILIEFYDGEPVIAKLPEKITTQVKYCEAVIKGQTSSSSNKPAIIKGNIRVMVPTFIKEGEDIVVNSDSLEYMSKKR